MTIRALSVLCVTGNWQKTLMTAHSAIRPDSRGFSSTQRPARWTGWDGTGRAICEHNAPRGPGRDHRDHTRPTRLPHRVHQLPEMESIIAQNTSCCCQPSAPSRHRILCSFPRQSAQTIDSSPSRECEIQGTDQRPISMASPERPRRPMAARRSNDNRHTDTPGIQRSGCPVPNPTDESTPQTPRIKPPRPISRANSNSTDNQSLNRTR
jgi:hypothetical protein